MSRLDVSGVAYLCFVDGYNDFIGRLVTLDRHQYSIEGKPHTCDKDGDDHGEDDHTCCYDDTALMMDLSITQLGDFSEDIIIPHVMKSGGDNCSLSSSCVNFITDELLVGDKADALVTKYFTSELAGKDCLVCIGEMTIKYPASAS